ncbi:MAG TPA: hypothetical protein VF320_01545 [Acidimicrobiales bacterium]
MSRRSRLHLPALGAIGAVAIVLAACGPTTPSTDASPVPAGLPAAQALPGSGGTWATLAMGRHDDPLNTFGEVFHRSGCAGGSSCSGGPHWTLATPPGVASNGGIMVAANPDGGLTTGFGVSLDLRFSPLAETADAGSTWTGGILPVALAGVPDALAASGGTQRLALAAPAPLANGGVFASTDGLSTWTRLANRGAVVSAASAAGCVLAGLSAVAITAPGDDLVAGDCNRGGRAGIFRVGRAGRPVPVAAIGPRVPSAYGADVRVVRLVATGDVLSALVRQESGPRSWLELATSTDDAATWTVSAPLATARPVLATGVTPTGGFIVLLGGGGSGGGRGEAAVAEPGQPWSVLATPPTGTAVLAYGAGDGAIEALVPSGSVLDVDRLGTAGWHRVQQLQVPLQFGSTSAGGGSTG